MSDRDEILRLEFTGELWHWRGPAPFHFVSVPEDGCEAIRAIAREVTYGWGVIPAHVRVGGSTWQTSLFPKDGCYLVPIKDAVRKAEHLVLGDDVRVVVSVRG
jgi:hypothetical protein